MADMDEGTVSEVSADVSTDTGSDEGFNVETASTDLASDLFPQSTSESQEEDSVDNAIDKPVEEVKPEVSTRSAPKAWAKEMHEYYAKLDPAVQDYIETREKQMMDGLSQYKEHNEFGRQMKEALAPYQDLIQRAKLDAPKAIQALMNAHKTLVDSPTEHKHRYFAQLAKEYGIDLSQLGVPQSEQQAIDPTVKQLMEKVSNIEGALTQRQQAELEASKKEIAQKVDAFASDKAHPYFDEVADDIVILLKTGLELDAAYEKAVWANPITRQKEIERINQETDTERTKKARDEAAKAKAATVANIRNRDTRRTPTETNRATMRNLDDALRETQREINSRSH